MNIIRLLNLINDSSSKTNELQQGLYNKLKNKSLVIGCEYNLYKSLSDILIIQEKVEFFLDAILQCNFDKINEKDFSVYISTKQEEYKIKSDFQKKCINEDRLIK